MRWLLRGINFLGFAGNILYELFILIDSIVYSIAAYAIQAFFAIAELDFVANGFEQISYILGRIMILCGVFALFKLSFTLINYIIDPGKANKSAETGTKLVKNILIAIVLLVSLNLIFTSLYKFQNSIIKNNVIPKIIYGADNYDSNGQEMDIKENAKKFANTIFVSLMLGGNSNENLSIPAKNAVDRVLDGASINLLSPYATDSGFNYLPFISFIVGVLVCYYFLVFAIELGIRMVKLLVLQILAPIPIIMSIDPTQKDKLKKFGKLYSGIYLSVFIRIFTVYLAFAAISLIGNILGNISETSSGTSWLVHILLIIAIFKATKELPKLIEDALGMKLGLGDAGKGFGAILKGTVAGTAGLVGGAIAGGITGGAGGALGGAFTGLTTGVTKGAAAKNAVGVLSASTGAIKGGFGMGAKVAGAGGIGAFMMGGVENLVGGKQKDAATIADFDKKIKGKDDLISERNSDIEKIRNKMDISNKGNDMRNNIENAMNRNYERTHGTLEDMLSNNSDIQSIQNRIANAQDDTERSAAMSELANKRAELTNEYNTQKDSYFANQLNMADPNYNGPVTQDVQELRDMINDYNEYVDKNGLSDRKITDMASFDTAKRRYELSNEHYEKTIKTKEEDKKRFEQEKKDIEKQKSTFEESGEYKRRNKRDEKPKYKSRDVSNNGGNTN